MKPQPPVTKTFSMNVLSFMPTRHLRPFSNNTPWPQRKSRKRSVAPDELGRTAKQGGSGMSLRIHRELEAYSLRLGEELQRLVATLAADAAVLDAAKRRAQIAQEPAVDPDCPGLQLLRDAVRPRQVVCPQRGG